MSTLRIRGVAALVSVVGLLTLSACATGSDAPPPASSDAPTGDGVRAWESAPPEGEVVGTGTVMDVDGTVEFCMGAIAESYPPQCTGIPLEGWSWDGVDGAEARDSIRWGAYALTGTYDGSAFTVTGEPMLLALYDPIASEDPTGGEAGAATEAELLEIQEELPARFGENSGGYLGSYPENARLWVDVVWDDGTLQQAADDDYGEGVVIIRSALRAVEG